MARKAVAREPAVKKVAPRKTAAAAAPSKRPAPATSANGKAPPKKAIARARPAARKRVPQEAPVHHISQEDAVAKIQALLEAKQERVRRGQAGRTPIRSIQAPRAPICIHRYRSNAAARATREHWPRNVATRAGARIESATPRRAGRAHGWQVNACQPCAKNSSRVQAARPSVTASSCGDGS